LSITPNYADAYNNLGNARSGQDKISEAIIDYQKAIALNPNYAEAHNNLGVAFKKQGQIAEAIASFQQAIALNPNYLDAYNNLGVTLNDQKQCKEAETCFKAVLSLNPKYVEAYTSLGHSLDEQGKLTEAIACYQRALALEPNNVLAQSSLGRTLKEKGMINEAIVHYKKALALEPTDWKVHCNLVFTLNYSPQYDRAAIFLEHQRFNEQHAVPLSASIKPHLNNNNPHRKLKIGYVSADLRKHSVAFFMKPIFAHHNHEQFEIVCYYNHTQVDHITEQLQQYSDHWIPCLELSDEALADKIRQDKIDILVDLSGHIGGNRLLTFARKPAPIQATYIGYPNTTGLTVIDYHITDNYVDPEGIAEASHSEIPMRMPASYYCFDPLIERTPVNECPALENGYITFCCFNNYAKLNRETFVLWAKILQSLPDAKLVIMNASLQDLETQQFLENTFASLDIKSNRLEIGCIPSTEKTFSTYNQIDIALDSYPYNGATTTCQALWMGVPVVTLVGKTHVARAGLSILSALGLTEFIASTPEEYIEICVKLASEKQYLQKLRNEMREKMQASPLMDGASFTRYLESEYRKMWGKWCDKND
jgi:predicted O-linked N-acetylglucosamine transferase (SPINDLY family)